MPVKIEPPVEEFSRESEPCTIYVVRHAESAVNSGSGQPGQYDSFGSPLTERGREQATSLAAALQAIDFAAVYTSDKRRATETAIILAHDRPLLSTGSLREGPLLDPLSQKLETTEEAAERMVTILREAALQHSGKTICAVTHGFVMRALLVRLGWSSFENLPEGSVRNTGYFILRVDARQMTVLDTVGIQTLNLRSIMN
jgi:broad specificity phosphatase PhoE